MASGTISYSPKYLGKGNHIYNTTPVFAVLTGGAKTITLYIPLGLMIKGEDTVTITRLLINGLRIPAGGYIDSSNENRADMVTAVYKRANGSILQINTTNTVEWYTVNNIPMTGTVDLSFTTS